MQKDTVEVVAYDPRWPGLYAAERVRIVAGCPGAFTAFEHIGSTAVPGLRAKPIIDMMVAVPSLVGSGPLSDALNGLGYAVFEAGMSNRLFLRRYTLDERFTCILLSTLPGTSAKSAICATTCSSIPTLHALTAN